ncbi:Ti-type conjugative transfer relaxase TraA [Acidisoma silvae]|uniref:Ti-type conjugative transfer relaxase TraA n=1 Tax=Acidisoma silvae TaxID=2802396 RepID=A0A963YWA8_9PROT|nr:Ti-type conjugative transfer relaxase TraA [Acidisoma silvae]MCB8878392.1 Ti-type conjugative transfer relaxase TraA [Acidisoma silvae]
MAIYHLSMKPICRTQGRSAVAAAAYRAAEHLTNARDGLSHDYTGRGGVDHSEIVLPPGVAADWARDRSALWNAAEAAEKRSDARTAREFVLALPHELDDRERLELTRGFAGYLAERYGAAVDVAIHQPHETKDLRNRHAHLLITTRQVTPEGLGEKTELEWKNQRLQSAGLPTSHDQLRDIRAAWETHANRALAQAGHDVQIDHRSHLERGLEIEPTQHVGVHATGVARKGGEVERQRIEPAAAARNAARIIEQPDEVLTIITGEKSVFDRRDIARVLHRYIDEPSAFQSAYAKVMASPALLELQAERKDEQGQLLESARLTTRAQFQIEHDMAYRADAMAASWVAGSYGSANTIGTAIALDRHRHLSDEQREAVKHVAGPERIAAVVGLAGAGKSTMLAAAKDAWERGDGSGRVFGAALAGKAAEGLEQSSGIPSRTLASWELSWQRDFDLPQKGDVFVIDEAGMVSSAQLARFVEAVDRAGAKLVLVGDPEQLQPINAGAAFRAIAERIGFVELGAIRRQTEDWQRKASVDFGRSRVADGLAAYADHGAVKFGTDGDRARSAIVDDVMADMAAHPDSSRIVLAHRRVDVRELNDAIRGARKEQGALAEEAPFATINGARQFAAGDRLVFLENNRTLGVKNGMLGAVERAEAGVLQVRMDADGGKRGRLVEVRQETYQAVDHGYATTIHKSQGATVDRAFVLASESMDKHLAYVSMTRHRTAVALYADRQQFRDLTALSERLSRSNAKETTLDYALAGYAERRGLVPASEIVARDIQRAATVVGGREQEREGPGKARSAKARPAQAERQQDDSLKAKVRKAQAEREALREAPYRPMPDPEQKRDGKFDRLKLGGGPRYMPGLDEPVPKARPAADAAPEPASPAEAARAAQRQELLKADSLSYDQALEAATVRDGKNYVSRPMTVADAARLVSPDYAAAADRLEQVRKDLARSETSIEENSRQRDDAIDQGDKRWQRMGTFAQYGHRMGIKPDRELELHEATEKGAAARLTAEELRRAERLQALPALEQRERDALAAVQPEAEAKLEQRQARVALAHEVREERMQLQQKAAQKQKLGLGKSQGQGIGR